MAEDDFTACICGTWCRIHVTYVGRTQAGPPAWHFEAMDIYGAPSRALRRQLTVAEKQRLLAEYLGWPF